MSHPVQMRHQSYIFFFLSHPGRVDTSYHILVQAVIYIRAYEAYSVNIESSVAGAKQPYTGVTEVTQCRFLYTGGFNNRTQLALDSCVDH